MVKNKETQDKEIPSDDMGRILLEEAGAGKTLTVRDDQAEYTWLLDAARLCRKKGGRFRLVDSGLLEPARMEWLAEAGADIYTSDDVDRTEADLQSIALAGRKGGGMVAGFFHDPIRQPGREEEKSGPEDFLPLENLILSGLTVFLSSGGNETGWETSLLVRLARSHSTAGSHLVVYHRGPISRDLVGLAESGSWIHMTEGSLEGLENTILLRDVVNAAQKSGANGVFHFSKTVEESLFSELQSLGAVLIFQTPHFDFRSPYRQYEDWAADLRLDHRAYYLFPAFFP